MNGKSGGRDVPGGGDRQSAHVATTTPIISCGELASGLGIGYPQRAMTGSLRITCTATATPADSLGRHAAVPGRMAPQLCEEGAPSGCYAATNTREAHAYESVRTFGVIVTARCDFAQEKADIINYVPVVPIRDWFDHDGWQRPTAQEEAEITSQLLSESTKCLKRTEVTQIEIETSIADYGGQATISFIAESGGRPTEKARILAERLEVLRQSAEKKKRPPTIKAKIVKGLLKDLQAHRLTDLYYLPLHFLGGDESVCVHVALLRQFYAIRASSLIPVSGVGGVRLNNADEGFRPPISDHDDLPFGRVARMKSPYTEHFLQRATLLFARIGVNDIHFDNIQQLAEAIQ